MLRDRNTVTHIYDAKNAELLASVIVSRYLPAFQRLADGVRDRYGDELDELA